MADKIATRQSYGEALVELGASHPELVVMDADLSGSTKTGMFAKAYPDRFFNMGIAEQGMQQLPVLLFRAKQFAPARSQCLLQAELMK